MSVIWSGLLEGMQARHLDPIEYRLPLSPRFLGEVTRTDGSKEPGLLLNDLLGQRLRLSHQDEKQCISCGKPTRKLFASGNCYSCFRALPQNDMCMMKPETCHYDHAANPCRDPEWGRKHCFDTHILYLALSSNVKVGITRHTRVPIRWIEQGATQAMPFLELPDRLSVGHAERALAKQYSDRTPWQRMLKNEVADINLLDIRQEALPIIESMARVKIVDKPTLYTFNYPALRWPTKIKTTNFERVNSVEGELIAIKGQYLLFDSGVINTRSQAGYRCTLELL
jgi:hypothetical protein